LLLALGLMARSACGQSEPTATRAIGLSVFGEASVIHPDYGSATNDGFVFGGDVTHPFHRFDLSLEPRFGDTQGTAVNQKYFLGDLRVSHAFGPQERFHPFAVGGVGYGVIQYNGPFGFRDNSLVSSFLGGLDYDLTRSFSLQGEFQFQHWKTGSETSAIKHYGFNLGVVYRLPFWTLKTPRP